MFKKNKSKPKPPAPIPVAKPTASRPTATSLAPRKEESFKEPPTNEKPASPEPSNVDDELANMDYSILDDNENQFESKSTPAADTTISEAESYATLFQNWENACNMMTDDQVETTTGCPADDDSKIADEVCVFF